VTPEQFGGITRADVTFVELEDGDRWVALGHVDSAAMCAALNQWQIECLAGFVDLSVDDGDFDTDMVEHLWAVDVVPSPDPDSWYIRWGEVTEADVDAFPITLVES
jgi:hypothetical protein